MTDTLNSSRQSDFKLIFSEIPEVEFFCKSVTLPGISVDPVTQSMPGTSLQIPGNKIMYDPVTIMYILDEDWKTWGSLFGWMHGMARPDGFVPASEERNPSYATVEILTNNKNPFKTLVFEGIFPINIESPMMDHASSEHIILSATFNIQGLELK
jgi:hypothetical protein